MSRTISRSRLFAVPCTRDRARAFVSRYHRHHRPSIASVFNLAAIVDDGRVCGVAMVGRPVARLLCDDYTVEVTRVATDGTSNACSFLLGACRRAAFALGFRRLFTYTLPEEGGASLRAAGWTNDHQTLSQAWSARENPDWLHAHRPSVSGPRANDWPTTVKNRWVVDRGVAMPDATWPEEEKEAGPQVGLFTR